MKIIKFLALLITPLIVAYFVMDWTEANSDDGKTARVVVMVVWFVLWGYLGFWIIRGAWRSLKGWWNKPSKKSLDEEIAEIDRQTEKQIEKSKTNLENLFLQELDDIEFRYAGSAAKWIQNGCNVEYCIATSGDKGFNRTGKESLSIEKRQNLRETEQLCAAEIVGVKKVHFLKFSDGVS